MAKWFYNSIEINKNLYPDLLSDAFASTCKTGHKDILEWLYNLSKIDGNTKIDINRKYKYNFANACSGGHKDTAEWLYDLSKNDNNIKININEDDAFINACGNGHLNIVEWLYNLSIKNMEGNTKIDIHANGEEAFESACRFGHLDVAKWLYNLSTKNMDGNTKININEYNDDAFCSACEEDYKDIAEWLYNLSKIDGNVKINIHTANEYEDMEDPCDEWHNHCEFPFVNACSNGHKDIAEWLYNLSKNDNNGLIDINICNNVAFRWACKNDHKDIAEWLYYLSLEDGHTKIYIGDYRYAFYSLEKLYKVENDTNNDLAIISIIRRWTYQDLYR